MLTLKEKERAAYLAGDAELSAVLARYADLSEAAAKLVALIESGDLNQPLDRVAAYDQCDVVRGLL